MTRLLFIFFASILLYSCTQVDKEHTTDDKIEGGRSAERNHVYFVKGPEGRLYVVDTGAGNALPIVFLHSFAGTTLHWKNQVEHYSLSRRVVLLDFRAHGQSDTPVDNNYAAESLAEDVAAVVDSLQLKKFILVGHSMGGSAAVAYTHAHPERVAALVLVGAPGKSMHEEVLPVLKALESDSFQKVMDAYMDRMTTGSLPETRTMLINGVHTVPKERAISIIKSMFTYDPLSYIEQYEGPLLMLYSDDDDGPNALHNELPKIPAQKITGTSHWMQLDDPITFDNILDSFLSAHKL